MKNKNPEVKEKQKYWYLFTHEECVLCGAGGDYKRRIYDEPKPEDVYKRHIYKQFVCGTHFI